MNARAQEALQILKAKATQGELTPSSAAEVELFPDVLDYANSPAKSNATVLLEKLRCEADRFAGADAMQDQEVGQRSAATVFNALS
jgi:hypothetical protein